MIRLSVFYPETDGASFDHDYYRDQHVPMACEAWGLDPSTVQVDKGIDGPYVAAVHFTFGSLEDLGAAMGGEGTQKVTADMANYTTIRPVMQTSEIVG